MVKLKNNKNNILLHFFFITLSFTVKIINENCDYILKFDIDMITVAILIWILIMSSPIAFTYADVIMSLFSPK